MIALISGCVITQALHCAAQLEIADSLEEGPKTAEELSETTSCSVEHLRRLLRALSGIGVFRQSGERFALTPLSDLIRRRRDHGLWSTAIFFGEEMYRSLASLGLAVRTGEQGAATPPGMSMWQYLDANPERGRVFDEMLYALGAREVSAIVANYDFSKARTVMDIGGGSGGLLHAIMQAYPQIRGVLFEGPAVIERLDHARTAPDVLRRCEYHRGSFFDHVPAVADLYLLKHVIHDWDDADAVKILRKCGAALRPDSRLLIIESLLDSPKRSADVALMDVALMSILGGRERTLGEYQALCVEAGLACSRTVETGGGVTILETALK